jgi:hypothetical protein
VQSPIALVLLPQARVRLKCCRYAHGCGIGRAMEDEQSHWHWEQGTKYAVEAIKTTTPVNERFVCIVRGTS